MAFAPVYGSPYVRDLEGERRYARLEDFHNFVRLAQVSATPQGQTLTEGARFSSLVVDAGGESRAINGGRHGD